MVKRVLLILPSVVSVVGGVIDQPLIPDLCFRFWAGWIPKPPKFEIFICLTVPLGSQISDLSFSFGRRLMMEGEVSVPCGVAPIPSWVMVAVER